MKPSLNPRSILVACNPTKGHHLFPGSIMNVDHMQTFRGGGNGDGVISSRVRRGCARSAFVPGRFTRPQSPTPSPQGPAPGFWTRDDGPSGPPAGPEETTLKETRTKEGVGNRSKPCQPHLPTCLPVCLSTCPPRTRIAHQKVWWGLGSQTIGVGASKHSRPFPLSACLPVSLSVCLSVCRSVPFAFS